MFLIRYQVSRTVLNFFRETNGYGYIKLQNINQCNQILVYSLGICSFLGSIKFLKMLRFSRNIAYMGETLKICFDELVSFVIICFVVWIAFVQLMHLIFDSTIEGYSSITHSMESAFLMMLGKFDTSHMVQVQPVLGPIIFCTYNIVILFFALNIFISIIAEAFNKVRHEAKEKKNFDFDFFDHILRKLSRSEKKQNKINSYRDFISIFPKRTDSLCNYVIRVSK